MLRAVLLAIAVSLLVGEGEGRHRSYLDENKNYLLEWESNGTEIVFTVTVNTTGWIGLGFSPSGGMAGADIVIGWVSNNGAVTLQDRHATAKALPIMDASQDYKLICGNENGGRTTLSFSRKLDTCDMQDQVITDDTTRVIFAYGDADPAGDDPQYHGQLRGVRSAALLGLMPAVTATNATVVDILPKVTVSVPADDTSYWCSLVKFPDVASKSHMVQWEPVITPGNEGVVHHMLMFGCYDNKSRDDHVGENASFSCSVVANMSPLLRQCSKLIAVWSIGGEATVFPPEVGYPFARDDHPGYVVIQTHYDNPSRKAGIQDASGFKITLTTELRRYDAGNVQAGSSLVGMIVPPGQKDFRVDGFCTAPCTQAVLPAEGVHIFGGLLHSHLLGRKMHVRHYRNDSELTPVLGDSAYDFNYQQFRVVKPPIKVLPGDTLQTTCHYDSSNRTTVTFGGESTSEEMCIAYLLYYPKVKLTLCESEPGWTAGTGPMYPQLGVKAEKWRSNTYQPIKDFNWTRNGSADIVQELYRTVEIRAGCRRDFQTSVEGVRYLPWNATTARWKDMPVEKSSCTPELVSKEQTTATNANDEGNSFSTRYVHWNVTEARWKSMPSETPSCVPDYSGKEQKTTTDANGESCRVFSDLCLLTLLTLSSLLAARAM